MVHCPTQLHHLSSTSLLQPMDQGIIANFKQHYRSLVLGQGLLTEVIETTAAGLLTCKLG